MHTHGILPTKTIPLAVWVDFAFHVPSIVSCGTRWPFHKSFRKIAETGGSHSLPGLMKCPLFPLRFCFQESPLPPGEVGLSGPGEGSRARRTSPENPAVVHAAPSPAA